MSELSVGELADELGLTFLKFEARLKRTGDFQGRKSLANFVSEELDSSAKEAALMKAQGMSGKVGAET